MTKTEIREAIENFCNRVAYCLGKDKCDDCLLRNATSAGAVKQFCKNDCGVSEYCDGCPLDAIRRERHD